MSTAQVVTPGMIRWVVEQFKAGFEPDALFTRMCKAGWSLNTIDRVFATLEQRVSTEGLMDLPSPKLKVPDIQLSDGSSRVWAGDRHVEVLSSMDSPRVVVLGGLLSDEECDAMIAAATPRMVRSKTLKDETGESIVNDVRTSSGMFLNRGESPVCDRIQQRIYTLLNWPDSCVESVQVLHYGPGAQYKPHYDYFVPELPGAARMMRHGGQRVATVVMYLNTPSKGGATVFPDIGLEVAAVKGNAVFFSYPLPHPDSKSLHGGAPVIEGEKWAATQWFRECEVV